MWHLSYEWDVGVDPDAPEVEAARHPHRSAVVLGPDARGEPVLHAVGPRDGLVFVRELLDGDDRSEDLGLSKFVTLLHARDDGRRIEEPGTTRCLTSDDDVRM